MKTLVTGGAGFIGSHVVHALLARGDEVAVLDDFSTGKMSNLDFVAPEQRDRLTVHRADIADRAAADIVAAVRPEVILMLAAQSSVKVSMRDPLLDARSNVQGLLNLLEAARVNGCRKVVFSSSGGTIYGHVPDADLPVAEDYRHHPVSFYGLTKSVASGYMRLYEEQYGLEHAELALGNAYGPRQPPDGEAGLVSIFGKRLLDGLPCIVNGDGRTTRDYVHVTDVAAAFVAATRRGSGIYNIGSGVESSVLEIYALLTELLGVQRAPEFGPPLPGEVPRVWLDTTRSAQDLGWKPVIPLPEGITSVLDWLREERPGPLITAGSASIKDGN